MTNTPQLTLKFSETVSWDVGLQSPQSWMSSVHMLRFITLCQENRKNWCVPKTAGSNTVKWPWLLVITGYFYGIIHFVNGVF